MIKILILILLFCIQVESNIWDNIFGNFKSPNLVFPKNWRTVINSKNEFINFNISISYSSHLGFLKAIVSVDLFNNNDIINASEIILNLKQDLFYYHSPTSDCEIYQTPQLLKGTFNNSDMTNIWKMIAFYNGETKSGLKKFDISGFFSLLNLDQNTKVYTYFNKKSHLNYIEVISNGKSLLLDVIEKLKETEFPPEFFEIPLDWKCKDKPLQNLTDINTIGLEFLKELINTNTNALGDPDYKDKNKLETSNETKSNP